MELLIIILVIAVVFGYLTQTVAQAKNIKDGFWWGFFLGIIGLIVVAGLPKKEKPKTGAMPELSPEEIQRRERAREDANRKMGNNTLIAFVLLFLIVAVMIILSKAGVISA